MAPHRDHLLQDERERLAALRDLDILGTRPEDRFDRITRVAAQVFGMPMAAISFITEDTQWFKSQYGMDLPTSPRDVSFCALAIADQRPLIVHDAKRDDRFKDNPYVSAPNGLRFYAGAPIAMGEGFRVGTLTVMDTQPRAFDDHDIHVLTDLATMVQEALMDRQRQRQVDEDLHRLRTAERQITQNRQQLQLALEGGALGLWDWDAATDAVRFSDGWTEMLGYRREELKPCFSTWEKLVHPDDLAGAREALERYFKGEESIYAPEFRMRHKEGDWRWIQSRGKVFERTEDGAPLRIVGTHSDITDRKLTELALIENNRQLRLAEVVAEVGHWRVDLVQQTVSWSEGVYRIHGVPVDQPGPDLAAAIGYYHPDDRPRVEQSIGAAIERQEPFDFELRIIRTDGEERTVVARGEPRTDEKGAVVALFGVFLDVTDRKRAEVMKDEFISTVNHELRTPLTSIFGSLDLLRHRAGGQLDEKANRLLCLAHDSCARLTNLVNDVLDHEKIAAGKLDYTLEAVRLTPLVRDIVEVNLGLALTYEVSFAVQPLAEDVVVRVDRTRFGQALMNLLSNAAKFSPLQEEVTISLEVLNDREVRVSVADHGPGIPSSFQARIFERFAQADSSASRKRPGTGLGLNITRSIIEAFGGKVTFETEEGVGTTFHFILPIEERVKGPSLCLVS